MKPIIGMALTIFAALSVTAAAICPASGTQLARGVSSNCSQSHQGTRLYSECYSTITYMDPATSEVFHCNGDHQVVTRGATVERFLARAGCVLIFRPFNLAGDYVLLDVTQELLPGTAASEGNLFPEGIAWTISNTTRELHYCSSFMAGLAGLQTRCVSATFK